MKLWTMCSNCEAVVPGHRDPETDPACIKHECGVFEHQIGDEPRFCDTPELHQASLVECNGGTACTHQEKK